MLNWKFGHLVLLAIHLASLSAQIDKRCRESPSSEAPGQVDVHCSCMEQLVEWDEPIYKLTVNQTGCEASTLHLDWTTLQTYIGVKVVVFDQTAVTFNEDIDRNFVNCSVTQIIFYNASFKEIPVNAFFGLHILETFRLLSGNVDVIKTKAFAGLQRLNTIEFANATIGRIESNAFQDLPQIRDVAFVQCRISLMESNAIHIMVQPSLSTTQNCPPLSRLRSLDMNTFFTEFMGRSLESIDSIKLPELGSRLLFFASEIGRLETASIVTNIFPYIIFGGNEIHSWKWRAIEATIENACDVSAFLLIQNYIKTTESRAFLGISGSHRDPFNTVVAIIRNSFNDVLPEGFLFSEDLQIPYIQDNQFNCNCNKFSWLLGSTNSEVQKALELQLVNTSSCLGTEGKELLSFLSLCVQNETATADGRPPKIPMVGQTTPKILLGSTDKPYHDAQQDNSAGGFMMNYQSLQFQLAILFIYSVIKL